MQTVPQGYKLNIRPHALAVELTKGENGFVFEAVGQWKPGEGPKWSTEKTVIKKGSPALGGGIKISNGLGHSPLVQIPQEHWGV